MSTKAEQCEWRGRAARRGPGPLRGERGAGGRGRLLADGAALLPAVSRPGGVSAARPPPAFCGVRLRAAGARGGGVAFILALSVSAAAECLVAAALGASRLPPRASLAGWPFWGGGCLGEGGAGDVREETGGSGGGS